MERQLAGRGRRGPAAGFRERVLTTVREELGKDFPSSSVFEPA
jgi:hypothetical protein